MVGEPRLDNAVESGGVHAVCGGWDRVEREERASLVAIVRSPRSEQRMVTRAGGARRGGRDSEPADRGQSGALAAEGRGVAQPVF